MKLREAEEKIKCHFNTHLPCEVHKADKTKCQQMRSVYSLRLYKKIELDTNVMRTDICYMATGRLQKATSAACELKSETENTPASIKSISEACFLTFCICRRTE